MPLLTCTIMLIASQLLASDQGPFLVTPEEMARRITNGVTFSGDLSAWPEAKRAEYLQELGIQAKAMKLAPGGITAASSGAAEAVFTAAGATLKFDDMELNQLTIEKTLMDQMLLLEQTKLLPSLDQKARESMRADILRTVDAACAVIDRHLGDIIPGELIDQMTQRLGENLVRRIHDPTTYAMKQHPDSGELDRLLTVFEERLALSRDRAVTRLGAVAVSTAASDSPDDQILRAAQKDREMENILEEVLSPLGKGLLTMTSPPHLLELNKDPDRVLPGYSATVRQWSERYREVAKRSSELARQELERNRRTTVARLEANAVAKMALKAIDRQAADLSVASIEATSQEQLRSGDVSPERGTAQRPKQAEMQETPSLESLQDTIPRQSKNISLPLAVGLGICVVAIAVLYFKRSHGFPPMSNKRHTSTGADRQLQ